MQTGKPSHKKIDPHTRLKKCTWIRWKPGFRKKATEGSKIFEEKKEFCVKIEQNIIS